jgi:hypothetical protein
LSAVAFPARRGPTIGVVSLSAAEEHESKSRAAKAPRTRQENRNPISYLPAEFRRRATKYAAPMVTSAGMTPAANNGPGAPLSPSVPYPLYVYPNSVTVQKIPAGIAAKIATKIAITQPGIYCPFRLLITDTRRFRRTFHIIIIIIGSIALCLLLREKHT